MTRPKITRLGWDDAAVTFDTVIDFNQLTKYFRDFQTVPHETDVRWSIDVQGRPERPRRPETDVHWSIDVQGRPERPRRPERLQGPGLKGDGEV
jgi:hypothetical protein